MSANSFDFPVTYTDDIVDYAIEILNNARTDWKADEYSDEFESVDNILRLVSQVKTQPKLLVSITEGDDVEKDSTWRVVTDEVTVQVMVCHYNGKSTAKQKRETLRIGMYVRKVLSGTIVDYRNVTNVGKHAFMPDGWELDTNIDDLCVITFEFKVKVPYDLDALQ